MNAMFLILAETAAHAADAGAHEAVEHSVFDPTNPEFWVYAGLTIFLLLAIFVAKAPKKITDILDERIAETRRNLDEAKAVRAEAEALFAKAKAQADAAAGDAAAIIAHAGEEAKGLIAKAKVDAAELTQRRAKMAEDKIAAAEHGAVAEVRAKAAAMAAEIAGTVIASSHDAAADKSLVDQAIASIN